MSLREQLLENRNFVMQSFLSLIGDECSRIVSSNLLSKADCEEFVSKHIKTATQEKTPDLIIQKLSALHGALKDIQIKGDILEAKVATEVPVVEPAKLPEPQTEDTDVELQLQLADKVATKLDEISYMLGSKGEHETAYLVEQTNRAIRVAAQRGTLFDKENIPENIQERNQALISEANSLLDEFDYKFENANFLSYVSAIRAEMRNLKEENPVVAANSLRGKWK